jgi:serine/threonine protein kinase
MTSCPQCGSAIPPSVLKGLCPACLLALAIEGGGEAEPVLPEVKRMSRQFGDYILGRQLGSGGMGIVYEATQRSLSRKVALKLIRDCLDASPVLLRRFTIEAEAAARLDHPNIVPIFEIGECEGQPFFSMGLVDGESLARKIARGEFGAKTSPEAAHRSQWRERQAALVKLMLKLARAVHHAHERRVIHRDLKPANILIDAAGEPHLTDFGLAKLFGPDNREHAPSVTGTDDIIGTVSYMSPEQATCSGTTQASDIYGLGAVMYALLTGRPPFAGRTPLETLKELADRPPVHPRALNPLVQVDLDTICMKCLEKNPLRRYASAEALAQDLQLWLENRPILARPVGPIQHAAQWAKRNPVGTGLIVSLCIGLMVSLVLLHWLEAANKMQRDTTYDLARDGIDNLNKIWANPATKSVTFSARQLATMFGEPIGRSYSKYQLSFGVRTGMEPFSTAQKYMQHLVALQEELRRELGEAVAINLMLFKAGSHADELLATGAADFALMGAAEYLETADRSLDIVPLACEKGTKGVIFVRSDSGVERLEQLRLKSIAFPNPEMFMNLQAKAQLAEAGLFRKTLGAITDFVEQGPEAGRAIDSQQETMLRVFKREYDAGVTSRKQFEASTYRVHSNLVSVALFTAAGDLYVARRGKTSLDQRTLQALQKAAVRCLKLQAVDEAHLDRLRRTIQRARQFEGEETPNGNAIRSAGGR